VSDYKLLIVDNDKRQLKQIKGMINSGLKNLRGTLGLSATDDIQINTEDDAGKVVKDIESDSFKYNIILADVFMPFNVGEDDKLEGGAKRIYEAIKGHKSEIDVLLMIMTAKHSLAGKLLRQIYDEQCKLKDPWAIIYDKPEGIIGSSTEKLFDPDLWINAICRAITNCKDKDWRQTFIKTTLNDIVGLSTGLQQAKVKAAQYANKPVIMLTGETGTGKELIAKAIHYNSERAQTGSFKPYNCGSSSPELIEAIVFGYEKGAFTGADKCTSGLIESSEHGTVFLDEFFTNKEIADKLDQNMRRLLRENEFTRKGGTITIKFKGTIIIGGSSLEKGLEDAPLDFRYRINTYHIHIPLLRDRKEDIIPLAEFFLQKYKGGNLERKITPEAAMELEQDPWHGNVAQLEKLMQKFAEDLPREEIEAEDVQKNLGINVGLSNKTDSLPLTKENFIEVMKRPEIDCVLTRAAESLGKSRDTLHQRMDEWAQEDPEFYNNIPGYRRQGGRHRKA